MSEPFQRRLILLGEQPACESLHLALQRLSLSGPAALITAGWEEDELDLGRLAKLDPYLPPGSTNLKLFQRSESLFEEDPEIIELLRLRQDQLRHLRNLYQSRLDDLLESARKTLRRKDSLLDLSTEQESAIEMVRLLDRQYFVRTSQICDAFDERLNLSARPAVIRHRDQLANELKSVEAIVISGGHAAIILNRLKIFGICELEPQLPIVAWSGGSMALGDQIVLFHDSPPQGKGNAELLRAGMSLFDRFLPLPRARQRLLLDDHLRVELFSRRFDYFECVVFDEHTILDRQHGQWTIEGNAVKLGNDGRLDQVSTETVT